LKKLANFFTFSMQSVIFRAAKRGASSRLRWLRWRSTLRDHVVSEMPALSQAMSQDSVNDQKEDMKYNYKESNSSQKTCPTNYTSSTIKIQYVSEDIGYSIVTNAAFKQNEVIFSVMLSFSDLQEYPDMHSIQIAEDWHWNTTNSPMRYIQHSCYNVNCKYFLEEFNIPGNGAIGQVNGASKHKNLQNGEGGNFGMFKMIALQQLAPGTVTTVNYNSFEWEMRCPFVDTEAPSEYVNFENDKKETKYGASDLMLKNGAGGKGRLVRGYKFVQPDEKKFLRDNGLLLKHIERKENKIVN